MNARPLLTFVIFVAAATSTFPQPSVAEDGSGVESECSLNAREVVDEFVELFYVQKRVRQAFEKERSGEMSLEEMENYWQQSKLV